MASSLVSMSSAGSYLLVGTSKNRLFLEVPLQFLAFQATKHTFQSGSSLKTEVFRDVFVLIFAIFIQFAEPLDIRLCSANIHYVLTVGYILQNVNGTHYNGFL